jgi:diguanylate cyclase (GGDEF)-like protein
MNQYVSRSRDLPDLNFFTWVLIVLWTVAVGASLCWNLAQQQQGTLKIVSSTANAIHEKNLLYRRWASLLTPKNRANSDPQKYQVGQIQDEMSAIVPMVPLWQDARPLFAGLWWGHGLLWLLGLGGIIFGVNRVRVAHDRIVTSMLTDPLTGIANRRIFLESLEGAMCFAQRHQTPLSIIMADLDNFKSINDTLGHNAGDMVIQAFAALLTVNSRQEDLPARFGGEEFIMLLPGTSAEEATILGERFRRHWEEMTHPGYIRMTASFGLATFQPGDSVANFIGRADKALYEAKKLGKNRVVIRESKPEKIAKGWHRTISKTSAPGPLFRP